MPMRELSCLSVVMLCLGCCVTASAASREVGPGMPLVIPISDVIGGTDAKNNAKNNPGGGYFSVYDAIKEYQYPNTHGNQLGNTAMVNDHVYWDSSPGGLDYTHVPQPDPGGGNALWWPIPGEWAAYQFTVTTPGTFTVMTRFSASWGPGQSAQISLTIDGVTSGPVPLAPDDAKLWSDTKYQVGGWWGHTMVSGTCPVGWALGAGTHVLKVQVEKFPDKPMDNGNIWIHYFKVLTAANAAKVPTVVLKPAAPRKAVAKPAAPVKPPPEPAAPSLAAPTPVAGGWVPPVREQATASMLSLIIAVVSVKPQEVR